MTGKALPFPPIHPGFFAMSRMASGSWDARKRNIRGPDRRFCRRESSRHAALNRLSSLVAAIPDGRARLRQDHVSRRGHSLAKFGVGAESSAVPQRAKFATLPGQNSREGEWPADGASTSLSPQFREGCFGWFLPENAMRNHPMTWSDRGTSPGGPSVALALPAGLTNGGVTTWSLALSKRLNQKSHPSKLICHSPWPGHGTFESDGRSDLVHCDGLAWTAGIDAIHAFLPTYAAVKADVFIPNWSWGTYGTVSLMSRDKACDMRVVAFAHTDQDHYYELLSYYEPIISKFVGVSETICRRLESLLPSRAKDICELGYPAAIRSESRKHDHKRPLTIAYGGRIQQRQKRIFDLIALVDLLGQENGSYHFKIAGDGLQLAQLIEHFERTRYSNVSIEFLGLLAHERMADLWASSDISVLFSEYEGMSISMLESMGQGCVPIVTDVSGSKEKIAHGKTGFIVAVGDVASMAQIIADLDADRAAVQQISNACIAAVRDHHGFDTYDREFVKIMRECMSGPPARWPETKPIVPIN
jgi:glycosyltransferase involved in cell wall biosynthesis